MKLINKIIVLIMSFLLLVFCFIGCDRGNNYDKYSYEFFGTFDTIVQVIGYSSTQREFNKNVKYVEERFAELNQLFDIYNDYEGVNNIKTINDNAGISEVKVEDEIIALLELCKELNTEISPKVNVAMGPVLTIWHDYRQEGIKNSDIARLPEMIDLQNANTLADVGNIIIDKENKTIFLKQKGMSLDVGAVAKGFATQLVCDELKKQGVTSILISSGGNVKTIGSPLAQDRDYWGIGIQNPFYFDNNENEKQLFDTALIENTSIVTSGDYQRFYYVDDVKYHHLIDSETLMPADYFSAVTVMTEDSSIADFLSTALFLTPYDEGRKMVEELEGVEALWVFKDGSSQVTDNMKSKLKVLGEK